MCHRRSSQLDVTNCCLVRDTMQSRITAHQWRSEDEERKTKDAQRKVSFRPSRILHKEIGDRTRSSVITKHRSLVSDKAQPTQPITFQFASSDAAKFRDSSLKYNTVALFIRCYHHCQTSYPPVLHKVQSTFAEKSLKPKSPSNVFHKNLMLS